MFEIYYRHVASCIISLSWHKIIILNEQINTYDHNFLSGYTPLMNAVGASDMGHVSVVHRLLSAGCDFNIANHNGMTALHLAASLGHNDIVLMLLNSGADVSVRNNVGESALDLCVQRGLVDTVRLLLQKSMKDINVMERYTDNSPTLLQRALSSGQVCICRMLVEAGYRIHSELYLINQFRNNSSDLDSNTEMLEWLAEQLKITHSLQQLCRVYIRRYVSPYIHTNVTELGLPTKLQAYVCLQDL